MEIQQIQKEVCLKYETNFYISESSLKLGISENVTQGILPVNGLRIKPEGDTVGWYIWAGEEMSQDPEFFRPLHVTHIKEIAPQIEKYLGLPPGWRFLIAEEYEDVWFDSELLQK